jgi:hypothetical protein
LLYIDGGLNEPKCVCGDSGRSWLVLGGYWGEPTEEADKDEAKEGALGASESEEDRGSASACASRESRRERFMKSSS